MGSRKLLRILRAGMSGLLILVCSLAIVACAPSKHGKGGNPGVVIKDADPLDPQVKIYFDASMCPKKVDYWDVPLAANKGTKRVTWTAYREATSEAWEDVLYKVYFDPFVGPGSKVSKKGVLTSANFAKGNPENIQYKYTIATVEKVSGKWVPIASCEPLDPRIIVQP